LTGPPYIVILAPPLAMGERNDEKAKRKIIIIDQSTKQSRLVKQVLDSIILI
jgi:hypothetical protein